MCAENSKRLMNVIKRAQSMRALTRELGDTTMKPAGGTEGSRNDTPPWTRHVSHGMVHDPITHSKEHLRRKRFREEVCKIVHRGNEGYYYLHSLGYFGRFQDTKPSKIFRQNRDSLCDGDEKSGSTLKRKY